MVEDIEKLGEFIEHYNELSGHIRNGISSNNQKFCTEFGKIVDQLVLRRK